MIAFVVAIAGMMLPAISVKSQAARPRGLANAQLPSNAEGEEPTFNFPSRLVLDGVCSGSKISGSGDKVQRI